MQKVTWQQIARIKSRASPPLHFTLAIHASLPRTYCNSPCHTSKHLNFQIPKRPLPPSALTPPAADYISVIRGRRGFFGWDYIGLFLLTQLEKCVLTFLCYCAISQFTTFSSSTAYLEQEWNLQMPFSSMISSETMFMVSIASISSSVYSASLYTSRRAL